MYRSTGGSTRERETIRFGTYNIRNRQNGGLESALRGMSQVNMDLGIFKNPKLTNGVYTCRSAGYIIVAIDMPASTA